MRLARLLAPIAALALALPAAGCGKDPIAPSSITVESTTFAPSLGVDLTAAGWTRSPTGLYYRALNTPPAGAATVVAGQLVDVRYTGWLSDGTEFQSASVEFNVGRGQVISGWDEGIAGMRVGERRRLLIPPVLGFGRSGSGPIPGNAVLVFDVEVLSAAAG